MATAKRVHNVGSAGRVKDTAEPDEVLDDTTTSSNEVNLYDMLRETLAQPVEVKELALEVPARPSMSLVFHPSFEFEQYQAWLKKAEDRKSKETNYYRVSVTVISHSNVGIRLNGQDVTDSDSGEALTIASRQIHDMLGVPMGGTAAAIKKLYGMDGHVIQTCRLIVEAAGYSMEGDVLEADDDGPLDR